MNNFILALKITASLLLFRNRVFPRLYLIVNYKKITSSRVKWKFLFPLVIVFLLTGNSLAQWEILNEGFKGRINTIDFVNEDVGWIAGENGTLLKTEDGGESWNEIELNDNWRIKMIDFITESIGWSIGNANDTNVIWKTSSGGNTWFQQLSNIEFESISVIDESNVYAMGNDKIFKTTSGGADWVDISPNLPNRNYCSVYFKDSQSGVVVGNYDDGTAMRGIILKTLNGGTDWNETIVYEFNSIFDIQFLTDTIGYFRAKLGTIHFICKTEDMCQTWQMITQHPYDIFSYLFLDSINAFAIMKNDNEQIIVMKSTDGGMIWEYVQTLYINNEVEKMYFNSSSNGYVIGDLISIPNHPIIYRTTNEGNNWAVEETTYPFKDICFITKNIGIIVGGFCYGRVHSYCEGRILITTNAGNSWNFTYGETGGVADKIAFINELLGYVTDGGEIYKTTDSGIHWTKINCDSIGLNNGVRDLCFTSNQVGWAVGWSNSEGAKIFTSIDLGESWNLAKTFQGSGRLHSIGFADTTGWAVGDDGMIVKYVPQNGWIVGPQFTSLPLNKVFFFDESYGWIAGGYLNYNGFQHILLRTTNGGATWEIDQALPYLVNDIHFINSLIGLAVGNNSQGKGVILKSTDGGDSWVTSVENLNRKLNSISVKENYAWAVGEYGLILRTTDNGVSWIDDRNNKVYPTEFELEQNYPNPFNPSTTIKYQLSKRSFVALKIFDVLGNEIETLVNKEQTQGVYEVEFSTSNLSSGIYLYKLETDTYSQARKMILIK